jgi:hypothetical protein
MRDFSADPAGLSLRASTAAVHRQNHNLARLVEKRTPALTVAFDRRAKQALDTVRADA